MNIRRLQDPLFVGDDAFLALVAFLTGAVLDTRVHGDHLVGFGTLIALGGSVGPLLQPRHLGDGAHKQGAERRKAAQNENEPTFHQTPHDQIVDAI